MKKSSRVEDFFIWRYLKVALEGFGYIMPCHITHEFQ
jgi:hypothetical protein